MQFKKTFLTLGCGLAVAMAQITESSFQTSLPMAKGHAEMANEEADGTDSQGNIVHSNSENFNADQGDGNFSKHSSFSSSFHSAPVEIHDPQYDSCA
ncbi:hypothetical protein DSO57_1016210 [Entomophthora muscae]|uniref:Uncharacterized protein n=1 Tax=Entomophthora muscae TaxID=34485 RepID=A0ACC2UQS0_9FUNG|nr:hypothetical protein DSO57_1016210 [Entomophthora muscae]